jgi:hypothetical protein
LPATKIGYGFGPSYPLLCLCSEVDLHHFRFVQDENAVAGKDGLVVVYAAQEKFVLGIVQRNFERIEPPSHVTIYRGDAPALQFSIFRGVAFKPFQNG